MLDVDEPPIAETADGGMRAAPDFHRERLDRDVERRDRARPTSGAKSASRWRAGVQRVDATNRRACVGTVGATRVDRRPQRVQHHGRFFRMRRRARVQSTRTRGDDLDETCARERGPRTG
jgi:hypothetical protein